MLGAGGLYTLATIAPILTLLAVTPIVTQVLGSKQYGQVAVAISVYQLGSVVLSFGLPTMVTRDALLTEGGFSGASAHVVVGSCLAATGGAIGAALAPVWAPVIFPGVSPSVVGLAVIAGAGLAVVTLAQGLMRAAERVPTFVVMAAFAALAPPILGLAGAVLWEATPQMYAAGLAAGYVIAGVVALVLAVRHAKPRGSVSHARQALAVGLPTVPHSLAVPALLTLTLAIAVRTDGLAVAGQLQVAVMLGTAVITVINAVNNAWTPLVFSTPEAERAAFLRNSTFIVSVVAAALICGYVIVAPFVVPFVGGTVVTSTLPVQASALISLAGVFHVAYLANIHLTFIGKRTRPLAILTPVSLGLSLVVMISMNDFTPMESLMAFAVVWPAFYAFQATFSYLLARFGPLPPVDLRRSLPVLAVGGLVALQAVILAPQPLWSIVSAIVACMLTAAWAYVLKRRSGGPLS